VPNRRKVQRGGDFVPHNVNLCQNQVRFCGHFLRKKFEFLDARVRDSTGTDVLSNLRHFQRGKSVLHEHNLGPRLQGTRVIIFGDVSPSCLDFFGMSTGGRIEKEARKLSIMAYFSVLIRGLE
jgi:hypothetical protein